MQDEDTKPTLKAVILDLSAVNLVDLTSVQLLVDARKALDRHASPDLVQWHFANIQSRWTKRALGAAGFGVPNHTENAGGGEAKKWKGVHGVAELATQNGEEEEEGKKGRKERMSKDVEMGKVWHDSRESRSQPAVATSEDIEAGTERWARDRISFENDKGGSVMTERIGVEKAPIIGVNRPLFHISLDVALRCARENTG